MKNIVLLKMTKLCIYLFISLNLSFLIKSYSAQTYKDECERKIYSGCNHQSEFSQKELENARVWLQNYMRQSKFKPTQKPCKRLRVRKNFKCLTENERKEFIRVIRELYLNGVMDRMADIHQRYWPATHKAAELSPWHRWFVNELEKEMRKISPHITIPYYAAQVDAAHPEKSIVWETLGTSGKHFTGYCLEDGLYSGLNTKRCVKRQWNSNGTVPAIDGLEPITAWLQLSSSFPINQVYQAGIHFLTHLAFGGYMGDMSVATAPYDIVFFLWHNYLSDVMLAKLELQNSLDNFVRGYELVGKIDQATGKYGAASLQDKLTYYGTPVMEVYQIGFGEMCAVTDQVVIAINQKIRNETVVPLAVRRLPVSMKMKYFPKFAHGQFDSFTHAFEDVGDCNKRCRPIPHFQPYMSTENGRRQMRHFVYDDGVRLDPILISSNNFHIKLIQDLNDSGYCSPYVTE